ncbi:MAG: DUF151 domain-containing protein [bacterium]|nr:DUF151 domain-containing protein [bacterium]
MIGFVEVTVIGITISQYVQHYGVLLQDKTPEERLLTIFIGAAEAQTIRNLLQQIQSPRPLTYDLIKNILTVSGITVKQVLITELKDDVFYAEIYLDVQGEERVIDARPSDAIAYALKWKVPIYVSEAVMQEAGFSKKSEIILKSEEDEKEKQKREINALKQLLNELISQEKFEEAVVIRDRIKKLEGNIQDE